MPANLVSERTVEFGKDRNMPKIVDITGIGPTLATACVEAGFECVDRIAGATATELAAVPGIGEMRAKALIDAAQSLLNGAAEPKAEIPAIANAKKNKKQGKGKGKGKKSEKKQEKNKKKNKKSKKNSQKKKSKSKKKK
jgi:NAD-dependent DNA ligase